MATDTLDIQRALQLYFDGVYEGDATKLASVFHPEAHLFGITDGKLDDLPRAAWLDLIKSRPSARTRDLPRDDQIVQIDQSGPTTAFAKVRCQMPPRYFTDYLTLVKMTDGWRVISKTYHTETR